MLNMAVLLLQKFRRHEGSQTAELVELVLLVHPEIQVMGSHGERSTACKMGEMQHSFTPLSA
jgi:hypothetical protein